MKIVLALALLPAASAIVGEARPPASADTLRKN